MRRPETATEIFDRWVRDHRLDTLDEVADHLVTCRTDADHFRANGYRSALATEEELIALLEARAYALATTGSIPAAATSTGLCVTCGQDMALEGVRDGVLQCHACYGEAFARVRNDA